MINNVSYTYGGYIITIYRVSTKPTNSLMVFKVSVN